MDGRWVLMELWKDQFMLQVFGYSLRGRSVGDIPVCTLVADNRKLSWLCDFP